MNYIINIGLGFLFLLTVSIGLKVLGFVNYSWWVATSPVWVVLIIAAFVLFILSSLKF